MTMKTSDIGWNKEFNTRRPQSTILPLEEREEGEERETSTN
jgi:hypothetical protein